MKIIMFVIIFASFSIQAFSQGLDRPRVISDEKY